MSRRRSMRVGGLIEDEIRDKLGQFDIIDHEQEFYMPEGMDRSDGSARPPKFWRMLDRGAVGQTVRYSLIPQPGTLPMGEIRRPHRLIDVRGDNRHPEVVTITGALQTSGFATRIDWLLRLEWGTENFVSMADVDLSSGTLISVLCGSLKVDVLATVPDGTLPDFAAAGVQVSYGQRAGHRAPQRTIYVEDVPINTNSAPLPIPLYARDVTVYSRALAANTYILEFLGFDAATPIAAVPYNSSSLAGGQWFQPVNIPNDARFFLIRNTGPIDPDFYTAVFGLAL